MNSATMLMISLRRSLSFAISVDVIELIGDEALFTARVRRENMRLSKTSKSLRTSIHVSYL